MLPRTSFDSAMTLRCLVGLLGMFLLTGCAHLHPWATDRDIEGTYDQVFQATLETLEAREFPLNEVDREEGRIATGKRPVWVIETQRRVETARAHIEEENGETEVRLVLTMMDQSGSVEGRRPEDRSEAAEAVVDKALSSSAIYDEYLDAIEERVEEFQSAEE
jgi:hypothetical protein